MNCVALPDTGGLGLPLLIVAVVCIGAGLVVLRAVRSQRGKTALVLAVLLVGGTLTFTPVGAAVANAAAADCGPPATAPVDALTIAQTSIEEGLAPGVPPAPITGTVTNKSPNSAYVTAVTVRIESVVKAPGAVSGRCDASDYVLLAPRMPINQSIAPGGSAHFAGASIGFSGKATNQDACQRATVNLRYQGF